MPTDQVRGLKAHGSSPAKGISGCVWIIVNNRFPQPDSRWACPGHPRLRRTFGCVAARNKSGHDGFDCLPRSAMDSVASEPGVEDRSIDEDVGIDKTHRASSP
jgi:hypothetical protein